MGSGVQEDMKWFKHHTDSLDDPFIHDLMDEFGATGYLVYFGIIEIICKENGTKLDGKLEISPTYLRRKLRTSQGKVRQVLEFCQTFGKLSVNFSDKLWDLEFTKIVEIKDNYTKDLQASSKKPSKQKEKEKEKEVDKEKTIVVKEFILPDWIPKDAWNDFIVMRDGMKPKPTLRAKELLISSLEKLKKLGNDPEAVIDRSTMNGWKGFYALEKQGGQQSGRVKPAVDKYANSSK